MIILRKPLAMKLDLWWQSSKKKGHDSGPCRSHWKYHTPRKSESRLASGFKMHLLRSWEKKYHVICHIRQNDSSLWSNYPPLSTLLAIMKYHNCTRRIYRNYKSHNLQISCKFIFKKLIMFSQNSGIFGNVVLICNTQRFDACLWGVGKYFHTLI